MSIFIFILKRTFMKIGKWYYLICTFRSFMIKTYSIFFCSVYEESVTSTSLYIQVYLYERKKNLKERTFFKKGYGSAKEEKENHERHNDGLSKQNK